MNEINLNEMTYEDAAREIASQQAEWMTIFAGLQGRKDALMQRLRALEERAAAMPPRAFVPGLETTVSDVRHAIESKWRRSDGRPLSEHEMRQKARVLELSLALLSDTRALEAELQELLEEKKDVEACFGDSKHHLHLAERLILKEVGDADGIREVNRAARGKRRKRKRD
jgi:hypothetical protein